MDENVSVVIPTYNEREAIAGTIETIFMEVPHLKEIIVVDDDSPDKTWQRVEEIHKEGGKIKLIRRRNKKGLPGAIWEGILKAEGDVIFWLDADFLSAPSTLTRLLKESDGYDIVVASRYADGGEDDRKEKIRVVASRLFNQLAKFVLQTKTRDLTSGYIIARKDVFNRLKISGLYGEYCIRFLYQAEKKNLKIKEVPYVCLSRQKGSSKTSGNPFIFIKYCFIYLFTIFKLRLSN